MSGPLLLILRIILSLGLYAFIITAMLGLWKVLHQQSNAIASRKILPLKLTTTSTDQPPSTLVFNQHTVMIGREPSSDLYLDDASVSTQHARFTFHHGQWWLEDLNSTNGTYINNEKLTMPTVITQNDEIIFGNTTIKISL